jgi:hypothetical protein
MALNPSPLEATQLVGELEKARHTVATDNYPMSLGEIISIYKEGELVINPQFQRLFRWSVKQKSDLIESLLIGIPVPPIFVYERSSGEWELIDGLQRVSTILEFFGELKDENGKLRDPSVLVETAYLNGLEGAAVGEAEALSVGAQRYLPKGFQTQLKRAKLGVQILKASSSEKSKFDVFQRLNGSGSLLTPQEIRTCIMVMHSPKRHKRIAESAQRQEFLSLLSITTEAESRQDHVGYYCRAIAHIFYNYERRFDIDEFVTKSVIDFLGSDRVAFGVGLETINETADLLHAIDPSILRKFEDGKFRGRSGRVAFETIFVGVATNLEEIKALPSPDKWVLRRVKEMWDGGHLDAFASAGVRASDRIRQTVPFGAEWFKPE